MTTFKQKIKDWITPALVVSIGSGIIGCIIWIAELLLENKEIMIENKQLQFETVEQRVKTKNHVNTPFNPVNSYIQAEKNIEQGKALLEQGVKLDSSYALMDKIFKQKIIDDSLKLITTKKVEISRAQRDSSQRATAQTMQLILKKLDTTK